MSRALSGNRTIKEFGVVCQKRLRLIEALRETAFRMESGSSSYEWGHMGRCNAGQLVQTMLGLTGYEIAAAADFEMAEWSEHARDYCDGTGGKVSVIFDTLNAYGIGHEALMSLENLSDPDVLANLPGGFRHLRRNSKGDVVSYMRSMAELLLKSA